MAETEETAPDRAFPIRNRPNQYVNRYTGDQDGNQDNRDYNDEEADNPDYYGDRSEGQVLLTENGGNSSSSELETEEIGGQNTDSDVEAYLAHRSVAHEYRAAQRAIECDALKTFANAKITRLGNGKK